MTSSTPIEASDTAPALRIKVCGMREVANVAAVAALQPDFLGFIFYPKSGRFVADSLDAGQLKSLPESCRKVGVFVDETSAVIQQQVTRYGLDLVQLHGHETPRQCAELQAAGVPVIKAFSFDANVDFETLRPYAPYCTYFLFDTKGEQPGGNGTTFDWQLLQDYPLDVPYFLAGGLDEQHAEALAQLKLPGLYAVDLNSRFELKPGLKDDLKLARMFQRLRP
ncbi:phosphoribosylanthranilate isomerase [Hymenobacter chitinivorans]|uniref:N-(5'-phosphoribosyl)anthranilate isomerase n=1 Tax=Hymenobacter chitinivorans DSM 11115 TaxID=1121954 RepID=A0A2M9BP15_9BACT|nr:phosphoribosylanthranilate isomerase [Hymenobacter chitinivorans]PJJ59660.1 phosphoribosylanthranilate isomerase [Hymenobacter chitinivorans DSM 11115]